MFTADKPHHPAHMNSIIPPTTVSKMLEGKRKGNRCETDCLLAGFSRAMSYGTSKTADYLRQNYNNGQPWDHLEDMDNNSQPWDIFEDQAIRVIYGSNAIDGIGGTLEYTASLCRPLFRGEEDGDEPLNRRFFDKSLPGYDETVQEVLARNNKTLITNDNMLITQREIIHAAEAFAWAIENLVFDDRSDWTQFAIRRINYILYYGLAQENKIKTSNIRIPAHVVPGEYRYLQEGEENRHIPPAWRREGGMPKLMDIWLFRVTRSFLEDQQEILLHEPLELCHIFAQHYHHFRNIQPFPGNRSLTERILLNCLSLKLSGRLFPLGDDGEQQREAYHNIARDSDRLYRLDLGNNLRNDYTVAQEGGNEEIEGT
ncbi:hypothetical protein NPX13_g9480 [Xylaria arbuscula]|uniref:Uncharacterized protein n=1 Tax=Xylaria arbuscula TaxID=114810 RepID=A0A9W8N6V7_9PEZI|nr:hypothetical protein NPX13_g9480 [Xylaria arbuscula]